MKKLTPVLTITVALILVGSLAYASRKKVHVKSVAHPPDTTIEEEALKAELLDATKDLQKKQPVISDTVKTVDTKSNEKKDQSKVTK